MFVSILKALQNAPYYMFGNNYYRTDGRTNVLNDRSTRVNLVIGVGYAIICIMILAYLNLQIYPHDNNY